jgi:D-glycero-D-manno-heptose 1,7-bisphosphate phosphatase
MLYIFDKDGTIIGGLHGRPANTVEEQRLLPGVAERVAQLHRDGHKLAVCSNQGGVAFGYLSLEQAGELVAHAARLIGTKDYVFCPHHPGGTDPVHGIACSCRKPQPGMIIQLMLRNGMPAEETIFIGDRESDRLAARAAGVRFEWAKEFFSPDRVPDPSMYER